jgi:hypothetical protein
VDKLTDKEFDELMENAIKTQQQYPTWTTDKVAELSCTPYQGRPDYDELLFQVTMNLVNRVRA